MKYSESNPPIISKGNKILTASPLVNEVMNREHKPLSNKEIIKIDKRVQRAVKKCGAKASELRTAINESRNEELRLRKEVRRSDRWSVSEYLIAKAKSEKQERITASLVKERNALLDAELPASEYKELIETAFKEYDRDCESRKKEIIEVLNQADTLINELYDETVAVSDAIKPLLTELNSDMHETVKAGIETNHRGYKNGLGIGEPWELIRASQNLHKVANLIK